MDHNTPSSRDADSNRPHHLSDAELDALVREAKKIGVTDAKAARAILMPVLEPELLRHARIICARLCHGANDARLCKGPECTKGFAIAERLLETSVYGTAEKLGPAVMKWPESMPFRVYLRGVADHTGTDTLRAQNSERGLAQRVHKDDKAVVAIVEEFVGSIDVRPMLQKAIETLGAEDLRELAHALLVALHSDASHTNDGPVRDHVRIARHILGREPSDGQLRAACALTNAIEAIARVHLRWYEGHVLAGLQAKGVGYADAARRNGDGSGDSTHDDWDAATASALGVHGNDEMLDAVQHEATIDVVSGRVAIESVDWLSTREANALRRERDAQQAIRRVALVPVNDDQVIDRGAMHLLNGQTLPDAARHALVENGYTADAGISRDLVDAIKARAFRQRAISSQAG